MAGVTPSSLRMPVNLPVFIRADLTSAGLQVGCSALTSAAEPAVCGLDMEVPLTRRTRQSGSSGADRAGAVGGQDVHAGVGHVGRQQVGDGCGPRELKPAMMSPLLAAKLIVVPAMLALVAVPLASQVLSAAPSTLLRWTAGR